MTARRQAAKTAKSKPKAAKKSTFATVAPRVATVATVRPPTDAADGDTKITIRLPRSARTVLRRAALDRGTSVQSLVLDAIDASLARDGLGPLDR